MMKLLEEKLQRTTSDLAVQYTEEEELFRKKLMVNDKDLSSIWKCTICLKYTTETPYPHPILKVVVCFDCLDSYDSAIFIANKDGTDSNCRWCAKAAKKFTCSRCTVIFCKNCIHNNFDNDYAIRVANKIEWICFICNSKPIWRLRGECAVLLENMKMNGSQEMVELHNENSDTILSQEVNVNNDETQNQSISDESEVVIPKKQLKPIPTSDDDDDAEDTQKSDKEFESIIRESEDKLKIFGGCFLTRIKSIPEKLNSAKSIEDKEKLIDRLDLFCSMALDNIQDIQKHIVSSRAKWKDNIKIHNNCTFTKSRPKNSKFNLSLKSTSENNLQETTDNLPEINQQKEDSLTALNQISLNNSPITPPNSGPISPSTRSSISEEKIEDTPIPRKQTARKKTGQTSFRNLEEKSISPSPSSGSISPSIRSSISEEKIEDTPIPQKQTARKKTGQTSFRNREENSKSPSPEIKKEETDASSAFSRETQKREDFNLSSRIKEDFDDEENDNEVAVTIETYRCDKTGEICQSYYKVHQSSAKEDISDDSEKTVNYDWEEMNLETEIKEKQEIEMEETETTSNVANQSESDSDFHSDQNYDSLSTSSDSYTERDRKRALASLEKDFSDVDSLSSVTSISSIQQSSLEIDAETPEEFQQPPNVGYVTNLNIAAEIAKLKENYRQDSDSSAKESDGDDTSDDTDDNIDPKMYKMEPIVVLDRHFKLKMKPVIVLDRQDIAEKSDENKVSDSDKSSDESSDESRIDKDSDNDTDEINKLINLDSLDRKRHLQTSSDNSSSNSEGKRKKRRKKKFKKSQDIISDSDTGSSISIIKSDPGSDNLLSEEPVQKPTDVGVIDPDDFLKDETEVSEDDSIEVIEETKTEKCENNKKSRKSQEEDEKSKWRKDKLLVGNLNPSKDSDTDETNDSAANEILKKEEEKYLQNAYKESVKRKRSCSTVEEISSSEDDPIVVSDNNTDSNDSDIQFVDVKDDEGSPHKKGRRNINKILDDDELKEETKLADKEESERKERITLKQRTLEQMLTESQLSQEEVGMVLEMDEHTKEPVVTIHHSLVKRLKDHQEKGIKFMWSVCFESVSEIQKSKGVGCILAHCMGLGKTMQVVVLVHALLTHTQTNIKHVLIVCPLSTVLNWKNEFTQTLKVCPRRINVFYINPDRQKNFKQKMFEVKHWKTQGGVLLIGYETFQTLVNENKLQKYEETYKKIMLESLINPGPELVVCDEGHMLKNGKTLRFSSLNRIKTRRRIILTGTPLQNNLIEYYYMVNFVKPHLLGTLEEYKNRFVNPISNGQYEDSNRADIHLMKRRSHILHKKLENTVQRFEEAELIPYLPEKHDYVLFVQLTDLQIKLYEHYLGLLDVYTKTLFKNYHALQNIWTHPALLQIKYKRRKEPPQKKQKRYDEVFVPILDPDTEDYSLNSNWFKDMLPEDVMSNISYGVKMELLFSVIKECKDLDDKLLVFSSSIAELDLIEHFLENSKDETWIKDTDYYRMDGTVAPEKRMNICNNFNNEHNKRARLFLVSHKVGGLGLNLTAANRVILMDVSWNPAYDIQSVFRVYRFGQTKRCYIYRFVSMGTMEEVVYSRAVTKLAIAGRVVDEHQIKRHFNSDDLQKMYSLEKDFGEPPTPTLPSDHLLARLWENHKPLLFKFSDHKSLLANLTHEELNEEERKEAWEEFKILLDRDQQMKDNMMNNRLAAVSNIVNNNTFVHNNIPMMSVSSNGPSRYVLPTINLDKKFKRPNPIPSKAELIRQLNHLHPMDASASTSAVPGPSTANPLDLTLLTPQDTNLQMYPNPYSSLQHLLSTTNPSSESQLMDYLLSVQSKLSNNGVDLFSPSIGNNDLNRGRIQIEEPENEP